MKSRYIILALIVILVIIGIISEYASALPGYNYYTKYEFTNTGTQTYAAPINFEINASGMIDGYYIKPDASDIAVTYLGQTEYLTAMNLNSGSAVWRYEYTTIPPDGQAIKVFWYGKNTATRNQPWIAAPEDVCTQINPGSFNFSGTQPFAIQMMVEPATYPGTKQLVIGKGDSWKLELYPQTNELEEPWYMWSVMSAAGNVIHSATITAHPYTSVYLWCWYNGEYICVSDGSSYKSEILPTGLVATGSPVVMAAADIIIDDLRITTSGSVTAPAGGSPPPAGTIYTLGPDTNYVLPQNADAKDFRSSDPDAAAYMANGITIESDTNGYGWVHSTDLEYGAEAFIIEDYPGGVGDTITGVSLHVSGRIDFGPYHILDCAGPVKASIHCVLRVGDEGYYFAEDTITGNHNTSVYYYYNTGTRTLTPNGQPWTAADINDLRVYAVIENWCDGSGARIHITELTARVSAQ